MQNKLEAARLWPAPDDAAMIRSGSEQSVGRTVHSVQSRRCMHAASGNDSDVLAFLVRFVDSDSCLEDMRSLLESLQLSREGASVSATDFRGALADLGVHVSATEAEALLRCGPSRHACERQRRRINQTLPCPNAAAMDGVR